MARINKNETVKRQQGLPTLDAIMLDSGGDRVPAQVQGMDGSDQGPAALTEGEFVWSIPAIIALGEGDYEAGISLLEQMHEELRLVGEEMISSMS